MVWGILWSGRERRWIKCKWFTPISIIAIFIYVGLERRSRIFKLFFKARKCNLDGAPSHGSHRFLVDVFRSGSAAALTFLLPSPRTLCILFRRNVCFDLRQRRPSFTCHFVKGKELLPFRTRRVSRGYNSPSPSNIGFQVYGAQKA